MTSMLAVLITLLSSYAGGVTPNLSVYEMDMAKLARSGGVGCAFTSVDTIRVSGSGVKAVAVRVPAGDIQVSGGEPGSEIQIIASRCASRREVFEGLGLSAELGGEAVRIMTSLPGELFDARQGTIARTDLRLVLPSDVHLEIANGLGDLHVRGLGDVKLADSLGDIVVEELAGRLEIVPGTGDIEIRGVHGEVEVGAGVGQVLIDGVGANVLILDNRTGPSVVRNVAGSVRIGKDHKGDVEVAEVGGDLTVGPGHEGKLRHSGVHGTIRH